MKRLILGILFLCSCNGEINTIDKSASIESEIKVLRKSQNCYRGICSYKIYVFNGISAEWYNISQQDFIKLEEGQVFSNTLLLR